MTQDPVSRDPRSFFQWSWKASAHPHANSESDEWCPYSDVETQIIEEAYIKKEPVALLDDYHINFEHFLQVSNHDSKSQRPIKRTTGQREEMKFREDRFIPNPILPSTPFADIRSSNFVKAVRDHFHFNDRRQSNDAERRFLVEKAVEGLIIEGKKVSRQKEAEWLAQQLLSVRDATRQNVWECCARLYCMQSFLYIKMNEWMRLVDEKEEEILWNSKVSTFGPFACLLYGPTGTDREKTLHVYRGVYLPDNLIQCYRQEASKSNKLFLFPAYTSTSRNQLKAEQFGNVLFVIQLSDYDSYDVSPYSCFDEEEQLIKPSFSFYIQSCNFDEQKHKWIIHLKSYLSL